MLSLMNNRKDEMIPIHHTTVRYMNSAERFVLLLPGRISADTIFSGVFVPFARLFCPRRFITKKDTIIPEITGMIRLFLTYLFNPSLLL